MKIEDFARIVKEDVEFYDTNILQDPTEDNFVKQSGDKRRKPVITLRHVNKLKRMKAAQMKEREEREKLLVIMYGTPVEEETGEEF